MEILKVFKKVVDEYVDELKRRKEEERMAEIKARERKAEREEYLREQQDPLYALEKYYQKIMEYRPEDYNIENRNDRRNSYLVKQENISSEYDGGGWPMRFKDRYYFNNGAVIVVDSFYLMDEATPCRIDSLFVYPKPVSDETYKSFIAKHPQQKFSILNGNYLAWFCSCYDVC